MWRRDSQVVWRRDSQVVLLAEQAPAPCPVSCRAVPAVAAEQPGGLEVLAGIVRRNRCRRVHCTVLFFTVQVLVLRCTALCCTMPRVHSAIGSLNKQGLTRATEELERLPELVAATGFERSVELEAKLKENSPRSVRGAARQRRRPDPLLLQPPSTDGPRRIQPQPPSIPSPSSSPWEQLQHGGQGWVSYRTPRQYYGLAGPSSLGKVLHDSTSSHSLPQAAGTCPHCEKLTRHCEKLRQDSEQLKRRLRSQQTDLAAVDKQRKRLDQKLLQMEREAAARALEEKQRDAIVSAVAAGTARAQKERQEVFSPGQVCDETASTSLGSPASARAGDLNRSSSSPLLASRIPSRGSNAVIVRPAPCPEGATEAEKTWVAASEVEGFVIVAGPVLLGDGHLWGKKRLSAPTPAHRRIVALAQRAAGLSPVSATKHFLLVRPPTAGAVEFDELTQAIPLAGCAVGCTITEGHAQCGRLRVLPSPSTTLQIPGGTYVEELWLSSLKLSDVEALQEMKEWATLLQPLTFE